MEHLPSVVSPHARRTQRVTELARLIGYSAGARPAEKILRQLGVPQSDDTVLRNLRRNAAVRPVKDPRVVGIDDWASLKGRRYGTIIVDLEKRIVIDMLSEQSVDATLKWLSHHPEIEVVSRDLCRLYTLCSDFAQ